MSDEQRLFVIRVGDKYWLQDYDNPKGLGSWVNKPSHATKCSNEKDLVAAVREALFLANEDCIHQAASKEEFRDRRGRYGVVVDTWTSWEYRKGLDSMETVGERRANGKYRRNRLYQPKDAFT